MSLMERREALKSLFGIKTSKKEESLLRPPYRALEFRECVKCESRCDSVCPEKIIKIAKDGSPFLDFRDSGCTFCDECAKHCALGVLSVEAKEPKIGVKIELDVASCLAWNKTMCFSCKDACNDAAISFLGLFFMQIDSDKCTRCGFCIPKCPVNAIRIGG